jgi:uncharacterized membrane protein YesL
MRTSPGPAAAPTPGHWSERIYLIFSTIAWWGALNALWLAFTLLGLVLLGLGPATVTACILARRRMRGEPVRLLDFAVTWRGQLLRGTAVVLPVAALIVVLLSNYGFFSALGPAATVPRLVTLALLVLTLGAGAYIGPMYAHYDLPLRSYFTTSVRFALARPAATVILLLVALVLAFATVALPVLLVTVSIGAWLHTSTWLCVRFFEENENRLAAVDPPRPPGPARGLPAEPLRIR